MSQHHPGRVYALSQIERDELIACDRIRRQQESIAAISAAFDALELALHGDLPLGWPTRGQDLECTLATLDDLRPRQAVDEMDDLDLEVE